MIVSRKLISLFVNIDDLSDEEIVNKLTFSGLEVEGINKVAWGDNLAVGYVKTCEMHPDSDHLHVLSIEFDECVTRQIVCGAPNIKAGQKVIVALEGCYLPAIDVKIKQSKIRGIESNGMVCSLLELGFSKEKVSKEEAEGIRVLPSDTPLTLKNRDILKYIGLDDTEFDINILANRPDCLSVYGVANEIGNLFNREVITPHFEQLRAVNDEFITSLSESCKQIGMLVLDNVKVTESPESLKELVTLCNFRPINLYVDIANVFMKLFGQPLHMYDLDKCEANKFIVRDDIESSFKALDEKEYDIKPGDIVITNQESKPLCLGGILGGENVMVDFTTKRIAIEAANFYFAQIRKTCIRLGLSSDASTYFQKGVNENLNNFFLNTVYNFIKAYDKDVKLEAYHLFDKIDHEVQPLVFESREINHRLGTSYEDKEIIDTLEQLGFDIESKDGKIVAKAPLIRQDIKEVADLSEEIFRLHSTDDLKPSLKEIPLTEGKLTRTQQDINLIRNYLVNKGLNEIVTYTLVSQEEVNSFNLFDTTDDSYQILHPMTQEHAYVRTGLIPSVLKVVDYNCSHKNLDLGLFEISEIDKKSGNTKRLCISLIGNKKDQGLLNERLYDFYDLKGLLFGVIRLLSIPEAMIRIEPSAQKFLHPGISADIYAKKELIGSMGLIHPAYQKKFGKVYLLEIDLNKLLDLPTTKITMSKYSLYPVVKRDIAVMVAKDITSEKVSQTIKSSSSLIKKVELFDVYYDDLYTNKVSLAYQITFAEDRTLKDDEVNEAFTRAVKNVQDKLKGELR